MNLVDAYDINARKYSIQVAASMPYKTMDELFANAERIAEFISKPTTPPTQSAPEVRWSKGPPPRVGLYVVRGADRVAKFFCLERVDMPFGPYFLEPWEWIGPIPDVSLPSEGN